MSLSFLTAVFVFCINDTRPALSQAVGFVFVSLLASAVLDKATLSCTSISLSGSYATCPSDYLPVSCSCGKACGSWDIQNEKTCHCQCANQDWTSARCCKIGIK
ncbi:RETN protein, partial [Polypterus senegalus]|nr:RETN protein [Polypterus senegalus]